MHSRVSLFHQLRRGFLLLALIGALLPTAAFAGGWGNQHDYSHHNWNDNSSNWEGHHSNWDAHNDSNTNSSIHYGGMNARNRNQAQVYWSGNDNSDNNKQCDGNAGRWGYSRSNHWPRQW